LSAGLARAGDRIRTGDVQLGNAVVASQKVPENTDISSADDAACRPACRAEPEDADLRRVVAAWPDLPDAIRRAVLALIGSATV
jgi:hypothetical protein